MAKSDAPRNPFEGVTDFFSELGRIREVGTRGSEHAHETTERTHASAWVPATDIFVQGGDLVIRVELAGVEPDEIDLSFSHGVLVISGTRSSGLGEGADAQFYVRERYYGAFRRSITLPEGTAREDISAEFDDGLVEITVRGRSRGPESRIELSDRSSAATKRSVG